MFVQILFSVTVLKDLFQGFFCISFIYSGLVSYSFLLIKDLHEIYGYIFIKDLYKNLITSEVSRFAVCR